MCDPRKPAPPVTSDVGMTWSGYILRLQQYPSKRRGAAVRKGALEAHAIFGRPGRPAQQADRVALPVLRVNARDPAAYVGLEHQRVRSDVEQRVDLDEHPRDRRRDSDAPALAGARRGDRAADLHAVHGPELDLGRVPEHLPQRRRHADRHEPVLVRPGPDVPLGQVVDARWEVEERVQARPKLTLRPDGKARASVRPWPGSAWSSPRSARWRWS